MKREKIKRRAVTVCSTVVCAAVIGWVGYSAFGYFHKQEEKAPKQTEVDLTAISDYMSSLSSEDTAE